jgi:hypothetical protein
VLRFLVHNVILLAGLVVCAFAGLAWRDADALAREGILATAIVVEKHEETGGKGNPLYAKRSFCARSGASRRRSSINRTSAGRS